MTELFTEAACCLLVSILIGLLVGWALAEAAIKWEERRGRKTPGTLVYALHKQNRAAGTADTL